MIVEYATQKGDQVMLSTIILILLLIVPGFIATAVYEKVSRQKITHYFGSSIIFSFLIFTINIIGLFLFRSLYTVADFAYRLGWISFCWKYALLSIFIAAILGVIFGSLPIFVCIKLRNNK